jgi:hypothetical protein
MENENQLLSLILAIFFLEHTTLSSFIVQVINNKEPKHFTFLESFISKEPV